MIVRIGDNDADLPMRQHVQWLRFDVPCMNKKKLVKGFYSFFSLLFPEYWLFYDRLTDAA